MRTSVDQNPHPTSSRRALISLTVLFLTIPFVAHAQDVVESGKASWYASPPEFVATPSDTAGNSVQPAVTPEFNGPIPTNDWCTSLLWPRYPGNSFGSPMFPLPLAMKAASNGLNVLRPTQTAISDVAYYQVMSDSSAAFSLGVLGLSAGEVRVAKMGDWTVTAEWRNNEKLLRATFGHGLPFVQAEIEGGNAVVDPNESIGGFNLLEINEFEALFEVGGATYAAYAPAGATWTFIDGRLESDLAGGRYFSVAALPSSSNEDRELFRQHAHVRIVDSIATWDYDEASSVVNAHFELVTESPDAEETQPLTALFRHQWLYSQQPTLSPTYQTVRGEMRLAATNTFTVNVPFNGVLPYLPDAGQFDPSRLDGYIAEVLTANDLITAPDTYWCGKELGRASQLTHLAHQRGDIEARDRLLIEIREDLEDWLRVGQAPDSGGGDDPPNSSAYERIEAESGTPEGSTGIGDGEDGGVAVTGIGDGDRITFSGIEFGDAEPIRLTIRFASGAGSGGSGFIRIRLDSAQGPILSEGALGNTGGWDQWTSVPLGITSGQAENALGTHDLVLECESGYPNDLFAIEWIAFENSNGGGGGSEDPGSDGRFLAYDHTWSTTLGYPGSYGSLDELNDHHFHYGYLIMAAATVEMYQPGWALEWGGAIEMLIKDAANWDRTDTRFPYLRNFDPYMGYAYASGHQGFSNGNNQESSSESINFSTAVLLWGSLTDNQEIRDLGIYLHAVESIAIEQYWFDADEEVFPEAFSRPLLGIVWNCGGDYATWWTGNPEEIHGINILPVTTGSLHLGRRTDVVTRNHQYLLQNNGGPPTVWQDILWSYQAFADPEGALSEFNANPSYGPENGETKAHTYHWLSSLNAFGSIDVDITADTPHYAVFRRNDSVTRIAWNPTDTERTVTFSDGIDGCVQPGSILLVEEGSVPCEILVGDFNGDGEVNGSDLGALLAAWGSFDSAIDLNGDGFIDGVDLGLFLAAW